MTKKYELQYLPLFFDDMSKAKAYIKNKLMNPQAAMDLVDSVEKAILERLPYAESFEPYHSLRERKYPYYRIYVKNYVIYYVVIDAKPHKIMEVRRLLYNKENVEQKL